MARAQTGPTLIPMIMTPEVRELFKRMGALMTVQDIAQELMSELDPLCLLGKILRAAVQVLDAETGSILIWGTKL